MNLNHDDSLTKGEQPEIINIPEIQEKVNELQNSLKYLKSNNTQVFIKL